MDELTEEAMIEAAGRYDGMQDVETAADLLG